MATHLSQLIHQKYFCNSDSKVLLPYKAKTKLLLKMRVGQIETIPNQVLCSWHIYKLKIQRNQELSSLKMYLDMPLSVLS